MVPILNGKNHHGAATPLPVMPIARSFTMGMIHGGWLVAKVLKKEGVEVVFTLSGGHIAAIYDGCLREGIRVVDTRHEQAAVHAAEGWAKCTRTRSEEHTSEL